MSGREALRELCDEKLRQQQERLRAVIAPHCDKGAMPSQLPTKPGPDWPPEAVAALERYRDLGREQFRRNSRRCSRDVSRFVKGMNSPEGLQGDDLRDWLNRY